MIAVSVGKMMATSVVEVAFTGLAFAERDHTALITAPHSAGTPTSGWTRRPSLDRKVRVALDSPLEDLRGLLLLGRLCGSSCLPRLGRAAVRLETPLQHSIVSARRGQRFSW